MASNLRTKTTLLRRQHILDAAIRVFDARGFRGATIRDIATEAGVSDGTVYNVFESKEALLLGILEPLLQATSQPQLPDVMSGMAGSDPAATLHGLIAARWASLTPEMLAMMRVIWSEALTNRALANLYLERILAPVLDGPEALFQALAEDGAIALPDVPLTLRVIVASFLGLALLKMLGDPVLAERFDEMPLVLAELLVKGLQPRRGPGGDHGPL
jgi:AcrR family transcriptional regulator